MKSFLKQEAPMLSNRFKHERTPFTAIPATKPRLRSNRQRLFHTQYAPFTQHTSPVRFAPLPRENSSMEIAEFALAVALAGFLSASTVIMIGYACAVLK
jgi:hypothetical protein